MDPSDKKENLIKLVKEARSGCAQSMDSLAHRIQPAVFAYIYRLTLNYNLAEDLKQETLLEMVRSLKNLRQPEKFMAWLYRAALSKVQHHFRDRKREKNVMPLSMNVNEELSHRSPGGHCDGFKNAIDKELSLAIMNAMSKLKMRHRNILILRCFEQLPHSQVAEVMNCSETAAQVLFFRAKRALKKKLSALGYGKTSLFYALVAFADMTSSEKATAATVVSAGSLGSGFIATIIGTLASMFGIATVSIISAIAITTGTIAINDRARNELKYPSEIVEQDAQQWTSIKVYTDKDERSKEDIGKNLIGEPSSKNLITFITAGRGVELKFNGQIIDATGDDIIISHFGQYGIQPDVYITDGKDQGILIGTISTKALGKLIFQRSGRIDIEQLSKLQLTKTGFDVSSLSLPFEPYAVRIISKATQTTINDPAVAALFLHSVQARTK